MANPIVTMTIKGKGDLMIELYPEVAEYSVINFICLV